MQGKVRSVLTGVAAGGLVGSGIMLIAVGSAASAAAASGSGNPAASVTISNQIDLTDSTAAVTFPTPATLPTTELATAPVSLKVSTNDSDGYTISVSIKGSCVDGLGTGTVAKPGRCIPGSDLSVNASTTDGWQTFASGQVTGTDLSLSPTAGPVSLQDTYRLKIPADTQPGTYSTTLVYAAAGN
jgi:hypothetical protein